MTYHFKANPVAVKSVKFTAKIGKVTVHKFDKKCTIQLGDPDHGHAGIEFHAEVTLEIKPKAKGKPDFGVLAFIQNTNYDFKRAPPLTPAPPGSPSWECSNSSGNWALDGAGHQSRAAQGINILSWRDSPGVFLEEGQHVFEVVEMTGDFKTYLCWIAAGRRQSLARIDWSARGVAVAIGNTKGDCSDAALPMNWGLRPGSDAQSANAAVYGAAAGTPVFSPEAKPTKWWRC